jgi:hypothetical protein
MYLPSAARAGEGAAPMNRKSMLISLLLLLLLLGGVGAGLFLAFSYEPHFYRRAKTAPGKTRRIESRQFEQLLQRFLSDVRYETKWQTATDARMLNSWLAEDFINENLNQWLPPNVSDPRLAFQGDVLRLGFRYGQPPWQVVLSLSAKLWLAREPNVIVVEILDFRAGAVPLTAKLLQDEFTERAREQNIKVLWYRAAGHPVAVIRFQADKREPTVQLQVLAVRDNVLQVRGLSYDPELRRHPTDDQPQSPPPAPTTNVPASSNAGAPPAVPASASPLDTPLPQASGKPRGP